jgi:hypothetical protein
MTAELLRRRGNLSLAEGDSSSGRTGLTNEQWGAKEHAVQRSGASGSALLASLPVSKARLSFLTAAAIALVCAPSVLLPHLNKLSFAGSALSSKNFGVGDSTTTTTGSQARYHIVFSTACNENQEWQAFAFFHSMMSLNQTGDVTRIASCADADTARWVEQAFERNIKPMATSERFHLFVTPDFNNETITNYRVSEGSVRVLGCWGVGAVVGSDCW